MDRSLNSLGRILSFRRAARLSCGRRFILPFIACIFFLRAAPVAPAQSLALPTLYLHSEFSRPFQNRGQVVEAQMLDAAAIPCKGAK
jgi:hypothetical protein